MFRLLVMCLVIVFIWSNQVAFVLSTNNDEPDGDATISPNDARIINGEDVPEGRWPFMVSLQKKDHHFCGGAILNDDSIITAAHCTTNSIFKANDTKVYIGHIKKTDPDPKYLYQVKKFTPHKKYSNKTDPAKGYDLAVVKLDRKIDFKSLKDKVSKVCLPDYDDKPLAEKCIAIGWGWTNGNDSRSGSPTLKQVNLPIMPENECEKDFDRKLIYCAGYSDSKKGTCDGDSGGPLVCPSESDPDKYLQYGITSYGEVGCTKYGYFSKTAVFLDFIRENAES